MLDDGACNGELIGWGGRRGTCFGDEGLKNCVLLFCQ